MIHHNLAPFPSGGMSKTIHSILIPIGIMVAAQAVVASPAGVFNIRDSGAVGDGKTLDTQAIQKAIDACAAAGGGQVLLPPGRYLSGTVHLKSHVTLFLDAGATLVGTSDLDQYRHPTPPAFLPEARWGKWHRALILGDGVEDIAIAGHGVIDGNKVFDPTGEERMRGPHTFVFINCRNVTVRDISFVLQSVNFLFFLHVFHAAIPVSSLTVVAEAVIRAHENFWPFPVKTYLFARGTFQIKLCALSSFIRRVVRPAYFFRCCCCNCSDFG